MKNLIIAIALLISGVTFAAESKEGFEPNPHGYWHCTAYAEGHGHDPHWSASATDWYSRQRASYKAMMRCERLTHHHCHDIHCHYHH